MASAWDDDWETTADRQDCTLSDPVRSAVPEPRISRAQRKILHQEANRQLWQAADTPKDTPIFIQARNATPTLASASPIKQAVKVLARRPASTQQSSLTQSNKNGAATLVDDEPDSEEEERQRSAAAFAERQARAAREREEKQRKYAEVRERLFGADSQSTNASPKQQGQNISRPGSSGPNTSRNNSSSGRGRGGAVRGGRDVNSKQLYDPDSSPKPDSLYAQRREGTRTPLSDSQKPIREPRGPDSTGRGFAPRNKVIDKAAVSGT